MVAALPVVVDAGRADGVVPVQPRVQLVYHLLVDYRLKLAGKERWTRRLKVKQFINRSMNIQFFNGIYIYFKDMDFKYQMIDLIRPYHISLQCQYGL